MVTLPPRKRIPLLFAAALLAASPSPARTEEPSPPVVRTWLALDSVDHRGRVPFNANAPLLRHLLDRASPPPKEGETVKGDRAEAAWRAVAAKEDGTVEDENGAWFFGEVEGPKGPAESVVLARLDGASALFVNGAGFAGDVYRLGTGPVPVALRPGRNSLFVVGPRGPWRLSFEPWAAGRSPLLREDATLPDVVGGEAPFSAPVSFRVVNAATSWRAVGVVVEPDPPPPAGFPMPPLWTGKATDAVTFSRGPGTKGRAAFGVRGWAAEERGPAETFELERRLPDEARRVTFVSPIDGSTQFYGYLPPARSDLPPGKIGLVLTLHGAGVDALGQARSYAAKPDFRIVAPTNRRPFGFDWQDWGAKDALEVMALEQDPKSGYGPGAFLTGHSMGGHGAWHLAANHPYFWDAVAPSAGWCSFDTYGGGPRPVTPLTPIWRGGDGGSRTEDLVTNLVALPTYVLHGTKDDNVPLSEAEGMLRRLEAAGGRPRHHFQEGAGHWWDGDAAPGADCVDWPGIFDLFRRSLRTGDPWSGDVDFTTLDTSLAGGWIPAKIHQPLEYGKPSRVRRTETEGAIRISTENVRLMSVTFPARHPAIVIDGAAVEVPGGRGAVLVVRDGGTWRASGPFPDRGKRGSFAGPFKRVFDNRFVLVVGTKGTDEENREMMELARFHAGTWWYRANGNAPVVRDADLLARGEEFAGRNLILYGNADVNGAWAKVVPASCPVKAVRGALSVGDRTWKGEGLGAVFVHPRADAAGSDAALVGAFASTGARGTRVGYGLLPFVSGVGYPDYAVFGEEFLRAGDGGVLAAGWFDHRWALQPGGFLREETK